MVDMEWNNKRGKCVSKVGSACDVPMILRDGEEHRDEMRIECISGAVCEQISGLPEGMGHCVASRNNLKYRRFPSEISVKRPTFKF